ncbi:MAG: hypothetical protein D4S01_11520 [Dehalococcoidia bacterium]|nr:MAG: hypothetical protein D4S01_11520 [Dehalococcoidia bacterium]
MGYTTEFRGQFNLNKKLDDETFNLLTGLAATRRMGRNIEGFGEEGEFYIDGNGFMGQDKDETVIDGNRPPKTQPSLWLQWVPTDDRMGIEWDGGEKFYNYVEWIQYLIEKIFEPHGYVLNGDVDWRGEEWDDTGTISIVDNVVNYTGE